MATSPMFDLNTNPGHWDDQHEHSPLLLTEPVTPFDNGYNDMDRLLQLFPSPSLDQGLDVTLSSVIINNNNDDWNWLNEGNF